MTGQAGEYPHHDMSIVRARRRNATDLRLILGDIAVRQPRNPRSSKINMPWDSRTYSDSPNTPARCRARISALDRDPDAAVLAGFCDARQIEMALTCLGEPLPPQGITWIRTVLHSTVT
jgi:hypothetical protein